MTYHMRHWRRLLAVLCLFALIAAGCGDSDDDTATDDAAPEDSSDDAAPDEGSDDDGAAEADDDDTATDDGADTGDDAMDDEPAGPPAETDGFDGETITLGYLTDQSGPLSLVGNNLLVGAQAYWDWVNSEGGVGGMYPVELEVGDTQDSEANTVQEYQRIKDDIVMLAQVTSTPPTQALLEFLEEDGIIAVPGSTALQWATEPLLLPAGAAYQYQMINLADWYINQSGLGSADDTFCVIRTNDKYGEDSVQGAEFAAEQLGFEIAEEQTLGRGDTAFTAQVTAFSDADCDVVFMITVAFETNGMLSEANAQGFDPVWLGALPSYINLLAAGAPELYENFYVAIDSPNFSELDVPGMAKLMERWEAFGDGTINTFIGAGYVQSIPVHALLEKAVEMGDLSRDGLQAALANLGEVELEGLADNYVYGTPENRVPAQGVRVYQFDPENPPNLVTEVAFMESPLNAEFPLE